MATSPPVRFSPNNNKSDITFVLDAGFSGGGAARVAVNLVKFWVDDGRTVKLITLRGPEDDFYSVPAGVERIVLGRVERSPNKLVGLLRNIPRILRLRQAIREAGAPVVVSFLTTSNVRTVIACIGLGKRVIISERNDISRQRHTWPWSLLRRLVYRYTDVVTANSDVALAAMMSYVPRGKLAFVPNPVVLPDRQATPERSTKILNVGRLVPQKNQALIIDALTYLGDGGGVWTIEVLGEGPEQPNLTALLRARGMTERVSLRGWITDPSPYYLSAGIFVLPSLYEGTPNVLLEAMAYGLPCVVADCLPGALEHVEEGATGLVFRGGDAADLAEKLAILMTEPKLRARLGAAARERMRAFTPERVMTAWDAVILGR